ncbi:MAG TPA: ATP-binding cassette domain-containing protein, partial [Terriglobia bacterium]|nr:ATP-binding cassette domain-containing protein [Terriglobia bacterium]
YDTRLGERGVNLSGGQKQRLTIARALVREPSILVLDDALSSVDTQTEERILRSLRERPGRNTEIIAAHRISTIQDADRIVALAGGRIVQEGTHRELIADTSGLYWKFYEQQRLREDLERYMELEGELS